MHAGTASAYCGKRTSVNAAWWTKWFTTQSEARVTLSNSEVNENNCWSKLKKLANHFKASKRWNKAFHRFEQSFWIIKGKIMDDNSMALDNKKNSLIFHLIVNSNSI